MQMKSIDKQPIKWRIVDTEVKRQFLGGTMFGLGWAMTGACPGPLYTLVGQGYFIILVAIAAAILGALTYGALRNRLPH
jgi:uncharacterized membrane protein YedE/YeeE